MKIHRAKIPLLFVSALLFALVPAAASTVANGQGDVQNGARRQSNGREQSPANSEEDGGGSAEAGRVKTQQPEEKGVLTRAVKRNFSSRLGFELTEKDKLAVSMNAADAARFAEFLERKDTGFARLYDVADCELDRRVVKVNDQCPVNMRGRGTSYSFRRKKYQSGWFSDLKIQNGAFQVTGLNVLGMLTDLGDVPLDELTLENGAISALDGFQPAGEFEAAREQALGAARGFKINDFFFRSIAAVRENTTYALRSIAFRGKVLQRAGIFRINILEGDKREDVIVVFRLIRRHENGSVSLLFRELKRTPAPKLILPKDKGKK